VAEVVDEEFVLLVRAGYSSWEVTATLIVTKEVLTQVLDPIELVQGCADPVHVILPIEGANVRVGEGVVGVRVRNQTVIEGGTEAILGVKSSRPRTGEIILVAENWWQIVRFTVPLKVKRFVTCALGKLVVEEGESRDWLVEADGMRSDAPGGADRDCRRGWEGRRTGEGDPASEGSPVRT
jgi:hypothetical protein